MAALLAAAAAFLFGALAVTLRVALRSSSDPVAGSLVTTTVACVVCVAIAATAGDWSDVPWGGTWAFFLAGIVAPGISQILFTRAVGRIGPSRTAILVGVSPVLSAAIALAALDEPVRVALVAGTVLVVGGGIMLAWEHGGARRLLASGALLGVGCAVLFAGRDNLVRWAERGNSVPGVVAAVCALASGAIVMVAAVATRGRPTARVRAAARPFLVSGVIYGVASACTLAAFDRGRVTVVSPLVATESLWAVLVSLVFLGRAERIGIRLVTAAGLVVAGGALIGGFR